METIGGIPVECLTGELAGIWSGWRTLGDREVVREASAKGTHISLAQKFLATRRNCSPIEAETYFYREVDVWVEELLTKQQVFRATRIITNVGKNPQERINSSCVKSRDPKLRDYLIQHLRKIEGLSESQLKAWEMFKLMENYRLEYSIKDDPVSGLSIEEIIQMPKDFKTLLLTDLYFHTFESRVAEDLSSRVAWDYLLMKNRVDLLSFWIDVNFHNSEAEIPSAVAKVAEGLRGVLNGLKITDDMIDFVQESSAADIVKEIVSDRLCRYGVFASKESNNFKIVLTRLLNNKIPPSKFKEVLSQPFSRINADDFLSKLNVDLYSRSYLEEGHMRDVDTKNQTLCTSLETMTQSLESEDALWNGILATINHVCKDSDEYLRENPQLVLSLVFLRYQKQRNSDNRLLEEIFDDEEGLSLDEYRSVSKETLLNTLHAFPHLEKSMRGETVSQDASMYELINGFENFNANRGFIWRYRNCQMPTFTSEYLVKRYGHKEKLNYVSYLKQGRPNMAARLFIYEQKKFHPEISSKMKCQGAAEAHVFALRNLKLREITSACVSFIEIIGVDSENLRLHLSVAKRISEDFSTSIGEQLETVMYNNPADLNALTLNLERCFKLRITGTLEEDPQELIAAIKDWDLNVAFARAHNASLPQILLEYFVERDLWFEFLLLGQIYAYPVEQMLKLAKKLSNPNVRDHLLACLNNPSLSSGPVIHPADRELKGHDSRQSLYSRIGVRQSDSHSQSPADSASLVPTDFTERNVSSSSDDLWMTILNSHHSQDPPGSLLLAARSQRSPLLVVIASCYEPSSLPAYWCSWLVISTDDPVIISDYQDCLDRQVWPADRVLWLLKKLVAFGYAKTLSRGLEIFMPDNPLYLFADFLTRCVNLGDFNSGIKNLKAFRSTCSNLVCNVNVDWTDADLSCLKNSHWISLAGVRCAVTALGMSFHSTSSQLEFLKALCSSDFGIDLPDAPDFKRLLRVVEILIKTEVTFNFKHLAASDDRNAIQTELRRCLVELARGENYKDALELCKAASLDCSDIITAQWRKDFSKSLVEDGKLVKNFWLNCAKDFDKYHVDYEVAAQFYVQHAEKVASHKERFEILRLAHETLKGSSADPQIIDGVEMAMWKSCFLAGPDNVNLDDAPVPLDKLKTELMSGLTELRVRCELTEPGEKLAVKKLIDRFIDAGNLRTALRIATIFNCKHRDLQILMLCLSLAEGEVSPYQLTPQQRMLLSTKTRLKNQWQVTYRGKGLPKVSSLASMTSNSPGEAAEVATEAGTSSVPEKQDKIDCITQLEKLTEILTHGVTAGRKVLLCYKLAAHLGKSYQSLLTLNDPVAFLEEIVSEECDYKLEVAKDVVTAYRVNNRQLAEFLSAKIVDAVTRHVEGGRVDQPMSMWGYPLDGSFHVVTELCSEPSLLGLKLLEAVTRLLGRSYGENRDVTTLKVIVELLIKSHDCFTASCNMEGIASILRKSQQLANSLQNLKQWGLLVRLLTGVGRFTEMNYILQMIKENEQFEFLLTGKGLEKIPGLKTALLDFLNRHCPADKDLFNLVAHHFRLYSEIASTWEREAKEAIDKLLAEAKTESRIQGNSNPGELRLTRNEGAEKRLELAMINYTHATEYYLQDSKLTLAYQCCHRAELVALQTSFLNSVNQNQQVPCVLNLRSSEIDRMICNDLSFAQANILVRAYNHPVDWGSVIYSHCILRCDAKYLKDFLNTNEITVAIVKDSAKRFQLEKSVSKETADSMQQLISLVKDVECKYTLASQLGFKNVIEDILADSNVGAYLKDTVWRKGYTSAAFD